MSLSGLSDPKVFGPGEWYLIHTVAKQATTEEKKRQFVEFIELVRTSLLCANCAAHMTEYIQNNPIQQFWNVRAKDGTEVGMFKWTWKFHNAVNARLGKPQLDWDTAYTMFYTNLDSGVCKKECGNEQEKDDKIQKTPPSWQSLIRPAGLPTEPEPLRMPPPRSSGPFSWGSNWNGNSGSNFRIIGKNNG
jgi:hypothetical protein